jgi:putative FmdB family regulatory protein
MLARPDRNQEGPMPLYDFICETCGPFEVQRPIGEVSKPARCPSCQQAGRRVFTPPGIVRTPAGIRRARDLEEKSAHEPDVVGRPEGRRLPLHGHHHHAPPWAAGGC